MSISLNSNKILPSPTYDATFCVQKDQRIDGINVQQRFETILRASNLFFTGLSSMHHIPITIVSVAD